MTAYDVSLSFTFDAAHHFGEAAEGHRYARLHGHSFLATVHVAGEPQGAMGFVVDFDDLRAATKDLREKLDHRLLNDIPGLETPSIERLALWIYAALKPQFPGLSGVDVARPSIGEVCRYRP